MQAEFGSRLLLSGKLKLASIYPADVTEENDGVRPMLDASQTNLPTLRISFLLLCSCLAWGTSSRAADVSIELWYGEKQQFGTPAFTQRWVNLLGSVAPAEQVKTLEYAVNEGPLSPLSFREDRKRIARDGDFNIEIAHSTLRPGMNRVQIVATDQSGVQVVKKAEFSIRKQSEAWPLPYEIDWSKVANIQDVVQVVDGKWKLTASGVRSVEPYYDRVLTLGDQTWENYEVTTTVTVHALIGPRELPNTTGVTHAAIATRWPGHDQDGKQPSVKWYPLGATAEFRLGRDLQACRWRIFDGKREAYVESDRRRVLEFEKPYRMKHRVETLADGRSRYRVRLWPADEMEPDSWDLERFESDDLDSGSVCLIAHHSDVTFGNVTVVPLSPSK